MEVKRVHFYIRRRIFEEFIYRLLKDLGYEVESFLDRVDCGYDLLLYIDGQKYICEIKYSVNLLVIPSQLRMNAGLLLGQMKSNEKGLLITNSFCKKEYKEEYEAKNVFILDIQNLLSLVEKNPEMYSSLLGLLDFSIEGIFPESPTFLFNKTSHLTPTNRLSYFIHGLEEIKPGKENFVFYQTFCMETLKTLFSNELSIWQEQKTTDNTLHRFDLICKIKNNQNHDFYDTLMHYFKTKYLVFEFKNYTNKITPREIHEIEKYLYDKALRKVAILISRKGMSDNALIVTKGLLREQGKLIISLDDEDIISMLEMFYHGDNPSDYLSLKLDTLLMELEK